MRSTPDFGHGTSLLYYLYSSILPVYYRLVMVIYLEVLIGRNRDFHGFSVTRIMYKYVCMSNNSMCMRIMV